MLRRLPMVAWITVVWVALWGDLSWANLLGGLAVAAVLLTAVRLPVADTPRRAALLPSLRYLVRFVGDLVVATAQVARQVFWPVSRLRPAILEVPMVSREPGLLSLVANSITLTPGTLTMEIDAARGVLWVHLLHLEPGGEGQVLADIRALERLGARALGVDLPQPRGEEVR